MWKDAQELLRKSMLKKHGYSMIGFALKRKKMETKI